MTRINTIAVQDLLDQHLFIEYREITRVNKLARHRKPGEAWPNEYILGTGHVKFFYDKGQYLANRCKELYAELIKRGYVPTHKVYIMHADGLNNDWQPTEAGVKANLARLQSKLTERPGFYKFNGKTADPLHYAKLFGANNQCLPTYRVESVCHN